MRPWWISVLVYEANEKVLCPNLQTWQKEHRLINRIKVLTKTIAINIKKSNRLIYFQK